MSVSDEVVVAAERPDSVEIQALLAERDAHFDRLYADEDRKPGKITWAGRIYSSSPRG